jgi:S-adenosylmethionine hydroxide adenosyltransferase-like protein
VKRCRLAGSSIRPAEPTHFFVSTDSSEAAIASEATGKLGVIVLFTDFGLEGPYTGQMKAVLAQMAPGTSHHQANLARIIPTAARIGRTILRRSSMSIISATR